LTAEQHLDGTVRIVGLPTGRTWLSGMATGAFAKAAVKRHMTRVDERQGEAVRHIVPGILDISGGDASPCRRPSAAHPPVGRARRAAAARGRGRLFRPVGIGSQRRRAEPPNRIQVQQRKKNFRGAVEDDRFFARHRWRRKCCRPVKDAAIIRSEG